MDERRLRYARPNPLTDDPISSDSEGSQSDTIVVLHSYEGEQELLASQQAVRESMAADEFDLPSDDDDSGDYELSNPVQRKRWTEEMLEDQFEVVSKEPEADYLTLGSDSPSGRLAVPLVRWIADLCSATGTGNASRHVSSGVTASIKTINNLQLASDARHEEPGLQIKIVTVVVWLAACFRMHVKIEDSGTRASRACKSLLHAGLVVLKGLRGTEMVPGDHQTTKFPALERDAHLEGLLEYWEDRLVTSYQSSYYHNWFKDIPLHEELFADKPANNSSADLLNSLKNGGIAGLAEKLMKLEYRTAKTPIRKLLENQRTWVHGNLIKLLATIDLAVLESMLKGTVLNRSRRLGDPVQKSLSMAQVRGDRTPAIYGNFFADEAGIPPLAIHWYQWAMDCRQYANQRPRNDPLEDWAEAVDKIWHPPSYHTRGDRRYCDIWTKDSITGRRSWKCSSKRRDRVREFSNTVGNRAKRMVAKGHALRPMQNPICNIGYSINPVRRLGNHAKHTNSNHLMNLTEALFMYRYGKAFRIQQLILYTCWEESQPWFGEIALTHALQGYAMNGTGFSHCAAGQSNISMYRNASFEDTYRVRRYIARERNIVKALEKEANEQEQRKKRAKRQAAIRGSETLAKLDSFSKLLDNLKIDIEVASMVGTRDLD